MNYLQHFGFCSYLYGLLFALTALSCSKESNDHGTCSPDYITTVIGDQEWMTENLSLTTFRNGDKIHKADSRQDWYEAGTNKLPAFCRIKSSNSAIGSSTFYNYYAVSDPRGLAPSGWHIPNNAEWEELITKIGGNGCGAKLKCQDSWSVPDGTNTNNFFAIASGYRDYGSASRYIGSKDYAFWHTSEGGYCRLDYLSVIDVDYRTFFSYGHGFSVRCIKD